MADLIKETPIPYEPKRVNRWVLTMITPTSDRGVKVLPEWVMTETRRPRFKKERFCMFWKRLKPDVIHIVMNDPIGPSSSQIVYGLLERRCKLDYNLEMVDPTGVVVEKWEIRGCEILEADFGSLNYGNDDIAQCILIVKPKSAKLVF
jgi:hypothetical protein